MNPDLVSRAHSLLNTLSWENQTMENQLKRLTRELYRLQRKREKMAKETVQLETVNQDMKKEITGLTCYARTLEDKLRSADEDLMTEKKTEDADEENNKLLQTIMDLEMEVERAQGECGRLQTLVKDADMLRDEYKAE